MMGKISKGGSFGGCVNYVMGKEEAKLLDAEGVLLESKATVADSLSPSQDASTAYGDGRRSVIEPRTIVACFEAQSSLNPRLGNKVGHISLNFSVQDKERITDAFMLKVAGEYMQKMGIVNTQYIVVRHSDRDHPHCHIVFNRVDNAGKTISDKNDRMRSVRAGRTLTEKYNLYLASGKENVNRQRLRDPDSVKYAIYDAVKAALPNCKSWSDLERRLERQGIAVTFKYSGGTDTRQGVIFGKDGFSFNGSKVDRAFSFSKLDATLNGNAQRERRETAVREAQNTAAQQTRTAPTPAREARNSPMQETRNSQGITPTFTQTFSPSPQSEPAHNSEPSHGHSIGGDLIGGAIAGAGSLIGGLVSLEPGGGGGGGSVVRPDEEDELQKKKKRKKRGRSM